MRYALLTAVAAAVVTTAAATPAAAKCTRLAFSVNDYGKDGPTKDAKALLDKYVAQWTAERGIKSYRTGKKDVSCELFLNLIVFDEHTCRAEATVCWDEKNVGPAPKAAKTLPDAPAAPATKSKSPAKSAPKAALPAGSPVTTGTLPAPVKPAVPAPAQPALPVAAPPAAAPPVAPAVVPAPPAAAPQPSAIPPVAPPAAPAKPEGAG